MNNNEEIVFSRKERTRLRQGYGGRGNSKAFANFAAKQNERKAMKNLMVVVVAAIAATFAFAQDAEIVKVKGRGVGIDKAEALKDAYRDAVERAVGLYVDAEQMMKNEELVKDQILTHSNAYLEKYDIVEEKTAANGLVTVNILAQVRKTALTKKLSDVMPTQTRNVAQASRNAHAVAVTEMKMQEDALALVKNELKGFDPVRQMMTVSLASSKPEIERIKGDGENIRLWYAVDVKVDESKYYGEFVPRWARLLDQIKAGQSKRISLKEEREVAKSLDENTGRLVKYVNKFAGKSDAKSFTGVLLPAGYRLPFVSGPSPLRYCGSALNEQFVGMQFLRGKVIDRETIAGGLKDLMDIRETGPVPASSVWSNGSLWNSGYIRLREGLVNRYGNGRKFLGDEYSKSVVLIEKRSGPALLGRQFKLPSDCMDEIIGWQDGYVTLDEDVEAGNAKHVDYLMTLTDESGDEVASVPFELLTGYVCNSGWLIDEYKSKSIVWFITPLVGARAKSYRKWIPVELPKDDVAKVAKVAISLAE